MMKLYLVISKSSGKSISKLGSSINWKLIVKLVSFSKSALLALIIGSPTYEISFSFKNLEINYRLFAKLLHSIH